MHQAYGSSKHRALVVLHGSTEPQNYRDRAAYIIFNYLTNTAKHRALAVLQWSAEPPNCRGRAADIKAMQCGQASRLGCTALGHRASKFDCRLPRSTGTHQRFIEDYAMQPSIALWLYFIAQWTTESPNYLDRRAGMKGIQLLDCSMWSHDARLHRKP